MDPPSLARLLSSVDCSCCGKCFDLLSAETADFLANTLLCMILYQTVRVSFGSHHDTHGDDDDITGKVAGEVTTTSYFSRAHVTWIRRPFSFTRRYDINPTADTN